MTSRRVNPLQVKIHWNYTARELADRLGVHKNTVRNWQRNGLQPLDRLRPLIFQGAVVRAFLISWNNRRKRPCPTGTLYCFSCREPRRPAVSSVEFIQSPAGPGNIRASCSVCGTAMHRRAKHSEIHSVLPGLLVQMREAPPRLNGNPSPSLNCDSERQTTA